MPVNTKSSALLHSDDICAVWRDITYQSAVLIANYAGKLVCHKGKQRIVEVDEGIGPGQAAWLLLWQVLER